MSTEITGVHLLACLGKHRCKSRPVFVYASREQVDASAIAPTSSRRSADDVSAVKVACHNPLAIGTPAVHAHQVPWSSVMRADH